MLATDDWKETSSILLLRWPGWIDDPWKLFFGLWFSGSKRSRRPMAVEAYAQKMLAVGMSKKSNADS